MPDEQLPTRILVIDDEVFVRELLVEYFGRLDYEVVAAESGLAGIEAARSQKFNVVLVDLKMPGINGIETLQEIRRIDPLSLIIIMTGYPTIDSSIEALRAGAHDYVIKPFKLGELRDVVERAVQEYQLRTEVEQIQQKLATVEGELRDYRRSSRGEKTDAEASEQGKLYTEAQMRELEQLRQAGFLSDGEYEKKRRELLPGG